MRAKYPGTCVACGQQIKPGKEILKDDSGNWVHNYCTQSSDLP